jgi:hypothetical protein
MIEFVAVLGVLGVLLGCLAFVADVAFLGGTGVRRRRRVWENRRVGGKR